MVSPRDYERLRQSFNRSLADRVPGFGGVFNPDYKGS
jgi:hypothetical protein